MARYLTGLCFIFLVLFSSCLSSTEASSRKLLMTPSSSSSSSSSSFSSSTTSNKGDETFKNGDNPGRASSLATLLLSALPKGTVPSSSPSKKGHATLEDRQLFERHLATIDRILRSVPSPGVGH